MKIDAKNFLEEIQALDEAAKTRVLVVTTAAIMIVVVYVWIGYLNGVLNPGSPALAATDNNSAQAAPPAAQTSAGPGFLAGVGGGMAYLYGEVGAGFNALMGVFQGPRQYIVQPQ